MYDLGPQFHIDLEKLKAKEESIKQGTKYRFTILTERLIRLEYSESGNFRDNATQLVTFRNFDVPKFEVREDNNNLEIETDYFKLYYAKEMPFKGTSLNTHKNLRIELKNTDKIWYYGHPEARNYFGSNISIETKDDQEPINKGMFSLDGFVSLDDSDAIQLDGNGTIIQNPEKETDIYVFLYNKDFGFCMGDYFRLTGNPALVPRYVLGNWWCRDIRYTDEEVQTIVELFQINRIPLSVFLFDKDWHIRDNGSDDQLETGYTFNTALLKDPKALFSDLHQRGIRVGLSINPKDGIYPHEAAFPAIKQALGIEETKRIPFDPMNPQFLDVYFKGLIHPLEEVGVDFFWNDYNDLKDLKKLWIMNYYHHKDLARDPAKRGMLLSRNALVAAHRYPVLYSGKTKVSWDNFKSIPFFNLSASNIGVCWWSHDIGGYNGGVEDPELYIRSVQLGTFSPILRFYSASGKYYKREPWRWDPQTFDIVRNYLNLRHRLTSYLYTEAYKYHKTGTMIFQPLYYFLPNVYDDILYRNEYFFGSELLVAPIVNKKDTVMNRTIHRFYLPEGMWYDYTTGKKFPGNRKYVQFYREEDYPVFAKQGAIIPLSNRSNINNTSNPTDIEIHIFPGQNNTYRMYEDDGISSLYKDGYYIITEIDYNYLPNNYTVIIRSLEGKSGIIPNTRNYKFRFRNTKHAEDVVAYFDNTQIPVTRTYVEGTDFIVEMENVGTIGQLTINCKGKDIEIDAQRLVNEDIDSILSDLQIETDVKDKIAAVLFNNEPIKQKRIHIRKLKKYGLDKTFIKLFLKLLEYVEFI